MEGEEMLRDGEALPDAQRMTKGKNGATDGPDPDDQLTRVANVRASSTVRLFAYRLPRGRMLGLIVAPVGQGVHL